MTQTLDNIRGMFSDLITAIESVSFQLEANEKEQKATEMRLVDKAEKLAEREKTALAEAKRLLEERAFLIRVRGEQKKKEESLVALEAQRDVVDKKLDELNQKIKKMEELTAKAKDMQEFERREQDLIQREDIYKRSLIIDKNRKEILDARERRIEQEEQRLKKLQGV